MLALLAAFAAAAQSTPSEGAGLGRIAWVFSTIDHSEWCPEGHVRLDLRTGRFELTSRADRKVCNRPGTERPVTTGGLAARPLAQVRAAYLRALGEGLIHPQCRDGGRPDRVVVSNGGTQILLVATGRDTASAPDDLSCWSEAAEALQHALDEVFPPRTR
jgi:hypothetical protein